MYFFRASGTGFGSEQDPWRHVFRVRGVGGRGAKGVFALWAFEGLGLFSGHTYSRLVIWVGVLGT